MISFERRPSTAWTMRLKTAGKRLLQHPIVWNATWPIRRTGCVVLTYHRIGANTQFTHISTDVFRAHMQWLRRHCDVIHPDALRDRVANPPGRRRPSVVVTFDDGYRDYYEQAYPILQELEIPAINFLPTRFLDDGSPFWWDLLDTAVAQTSLKAAPGPEGTPLRLDSLDAKRTFSRRWKAVLKGLAAPDRSPLLDDALTALGTRRDEVQVDRQVMTWDQVRKVGEFTVAGGHTHTHRLMPFLDASELDDEVCICRDRIEIETGRRPRFFAYPSGQWSDEARASVGRGGYDTAFTTHEDFNSADAIEWLTLNRIHAPATATDLGSVLSGWTRRV